MNMNDNNATDGGSDLTSECNTRHSVQHNARRTMRRNALKLALRGAAGAIVAVVGVATAHAGYGQCSVSGCACRGYSGSQQLCQNCGHQYGMHW